MVKSLKSVSEKFMAAVSARIQLYSRSYMHFCVPWILDEFSSDPCTGTTNDFDCCLH